MRKFLGRRGHKEAQRTQRINVRVMIISENKVVSLRYIMTNSAGEVIEDVMDRSPIQYIHGTGKIIPALEAAIEGMTAGQKKSFSISDPGLSENLHFDLVIDEVREATPEEIQNGNPACGPGCCC